MLILWISSRYPNSISIGYLPSKLQSIKATSLCFTLISLSTFISFPSVLYRSVEGNSLFYNSENVVNKSLVLSISVRPAAVTHKLTLMDILIMDKLCKIRFSPSCLVPFQLAVAYTTVWFTYHKTSLCFITLYNISLKTAAGGVCPLMLKSNIISFFFTLKLHLGEQREHTDTMNISLAAGMETAGVDV